MISELAYAKIMHGVSLFIVEHLIIKGASDKKSGASPLKTIAENFDVFMTIVACLQLSVSVTS